MSELWDDEHRKIAWLIMLRMRFDTHTEVNPTISNAYVYLQKYFNSDQTIDYDLYIIVISALLVAFKNEDLKCDIRYLFTVFIRSCIDYTQIFSPDKIISIFNCTNLEIRTISPIEESKVNDCEMDILEAINYETQVELPFLFFNKCLLQYVSTTDTSNESKFYMDNDSLQTINKAFELNVIKFFSASEYLELPISVIAAISLFGAIKGKPMPPQTVEWLDNTKKEFGPEVCGKVFSVLKRQVQFLNLTPRPSTQEASS